MNQYSNPNQFFREIIENYPQSEEFLETARHELSTAAFDLIEIVGPNEDTSTIESCMREVLAEQDRTKMFTKIFEKMKRDWQTEEINYETNIEEILNPLLDEAYEKVSQTNYDESDVMQNYYERIESKKREAGAANEADKQESSNNNELDEDVQVSLDVQQRKCPYTQKPIENPVSNGECGHVYEETAVKAIIKQRRGKVKCPIPGCSVQLTMESLRKFR